jgi:hypothetical protein
MGALIAMSLALAVALITIPYYQSYVAPWHKAVLRVVVRVLEKSPGGKLMDDIAFHLNMGTLSPPLQTQDGYYLLRVLSRESNRPLSRARIEMLKDLALDRWLGKKAQEGSSQGWLVWYWDSNRYA